MSSSPTDPATITTRAFASRRKGFDPDEVRAYLGQLAEVVSRLATERGEAEARVKRLEREAAEAPEIDEDRLTAALGEETAKVLAAARHAANEMKERADERVARVLKEAAEEAGAVRRDAETAAAATRDEVARIRSDAQQASDESRRTATAEAERLQAEARDAADAAQAAAEAERKAAGTEAQEIRTEAEADAATIRSEAEELLGVRRAAAEEEATRIREAVEAEAAGLRAAAEAEAGTIRAVGETERETARNEGRGMVAEAQRVRERMLRDLARRRKSARTQLEQLQAARDSLLEAYENVRVTLDESTADLTGALTEARRAADGARLRADAEPEASVEQLEAQISAARSAGLPLVAGDEDNDAVDPIDLAAVESGAAPLAIAAEEAEPSSGDESAPVEVGVTGASDAGEASAEPPDPDGGDPQPAPAAAGGDEASEASNGSATPDAGRSSGPGTDPAPGLGDESAAGIDALFAQLKASREEEAVKAHEGRNITTDRDEAVAAGLEPATTAESVTSAAATAAGVDATTGADVDGATARLLERRDGLLEPIEARMARKLKRALTDEQGRVLDGIRRARGGADPADLLPREEQVSGYAAAALEDLHAAAEEGATFEGGALPSHVEIGDLADTLASVLAALVRPRVERCFESGQDEDDLSDRIRSTYREWKTQRILDATRHVVLGAFSRGQCAVLPVGTTLRWVLDETSGSCPDGADNALAGEVEVGQPFPTGHTSPPAHPDCRCLIVSEHTIAPVGAWPRR